MKYELTAYDLDSNPENWANWSRGVLMYAKNAALLHLPIIRMVESSMPAFAAVVTAPMRKLW